MAPRHYEEQLLLPSQLGFALYESDPGPGGDEVRIGDVGCVYDGRFKTFANVFTAGNGIATALDEEPRENERFANLDKGVHSSKGVGGEEEAEGNLSSAYLSSGSATLIRKYSATVEKTTIPEKLREHFMKFLPSVYELAKSKGYVENLQNVILVSRRIIPSVISDDTSAIDALEGKSMLVSQRPTPSDSDPRNHDRDTPPDRRLPKIPSVTVTAKSPSPPNVIGQDPFNVSPPMYTMSSDDSDDQGALLAHFQELNLKAHDAELPGQVMRLQSQREEQSGGVVGPSPPTILGISPLAPNMEASFEKRTQARTRKLCAPNRAGNSLCSWHDIRRERRAHPPRMAPEGILNCGCTYEEALFEESLARNGVGSYHPGDSVQLDPLLRNALLRLLKQRYGYHNGDFEIDPWTGRWVEGEGDVKWEQKLLRPGRVPK